MFITRIFKFNIVISYNLDITFITNDFIKLNTGMTELLRPSIYGAQHLISLLQSKAQKSTKDYVVVGHCCESGDILTPAPGAPELLAPRNLPVASIGDYCVIDGAGA